MCVFTCVHVSRARAPAHTPPSPWRARAHTRIQDEDDDALESAFRGGGGAGMEGGGGGDEMEEDDAPAVPGAGSVILHNSAYIG